MTHIERDIYADSIASIDIISYHLSTINNTKVPVYDGLPPIQSIGSIIFDSLSNAFYTSNGFTWITGSSSTLPVSLQSIANLNTVGNEMIYTIAPNTYNTSPITSLGRNFLSAASQLSQQTILGLIPGTTIQPYSSILDSVVTIGSGSADNILYSTGSGLSNTILTSYARTNILNISSLSGFRSTLGLSYLPSDPNGGYNLSGDVVLGMNSTQTILNKTINANGSNTLILGTSTTLQGIPFSTSGSTTNGNILTIVGGSLQLTPPIVSGNVAGPVSATLNAIAKYSTNTSLKNSGIIIDDSNVITGVVDLTASGTITGVFLSGTISTVSQPNITSVGTLLTLNVAGTTTINGILNINNGGTVPTTKRITLIDQPTNNNDASNKIYVDNSISTAVSSKVTGPVTGTLNAIARYSNATLLKNSGVIIDDSNVITGVVDLTASGTITGAFLTGTIFTSSQPNITSIGTLLTLNVTGTTTINGTLNINNGGTVPTTKRLTLIDQPSSNNDASNKIYVDNSISTAVSSKVTGPVTGTLNAIARYSNATLLKNSGVIIDDSNVITGVSALTSTGLISANSLSATTITGILSTVTQPNITSVGTLNSLQVAGLVTMDGGAIITSGQILTIIDSPMNSTDATNKNYVDNAVSNSGKQFASASAATTTILPDTPAYNSASGTLTATAGSLSLTIDGIIVNANDGKRLVIKDQVNPTQNGIYTRVGDLGGTNWQLLRTTDANQPTDLTINSSIFITGGTINSNTGWKLQQTVTQLNPALPTPGTSDVIWVQYGGSQNIQAGAGMTQIGNMFNVIGTTNRITVGTTVDISASYIGQTSITTLGTITSGTWNGSVILPTYGGTGLSNPSADNVLITNGAGAMTLKTNPLGAFVGTIDTQTLTNKILSTSRINTSNTVFANSNITSNTLTFDTSTLTSAITLTVPDTTDTLTLNNFSQTLLNKTLTSSTNNILARGLWTNSGLNSVSTYLSPNPTVGQVLTATTSTTATWQTLPNSLTSINSQTGPAVVITGTAGNIVVNTAVNTITLDLETTTVIAGSYTLSNITVDGQGRLTAASSGTVSLTSNVSGILPIANGGTNSSTALNNNRIMVSNAGAIKESTSLSNGQILIGSTGLAPVVSTITAGTGINITNGAGSIITALSNTAVTAGSYTLSNITVDAQGRLTAASSGTVSLTTNVSGVLPIANGGTNSSTTLNNNRIMVSNTGAIRESASLSNGQVLIGSTGSAPVVSTITAGTGINITNGAGSITVTLPNTAVTPGTYFPASITVDQQGRITSANSSGVVPIANGGTNSSTALTGNKIMISNATSIIESAALNNGQILIGSTGLAPVIANITAGTGITVTNGAGSITTSLSNTTVTAGSYTLSNITVDAQGRLTAASSGTVSLTSNVSGILPIANGGTNSSTALNNNRIMISNTGAIKESAALSNGQILIGSTGSAPVVSTITAGTGITITNGVGSITLSLPNTAVTAGSYFPANITVDAQGRLTAASSQAISLTSNVSGILPIANGGTNSSTALTGNKIMVSNATSIIESAELSNGQLLIGSTIGSPVVANITAGAGITVTNGAGSITLSLPNTAVTAGSYTLSNITVDAQGRLTAASSGTVSLTSNVSGILPIANGGTNSSTALTGNKIMISSATSIIESAALSNGQILIGSTGLAPVVSTITAGTGITVTNGAGSITLSLPNTAVTAGSYTLASITVDAQGRLTAASSGTVSLTSNVSGILPIANGGTNSSTALNNNRIMVSNTGAIKESAALTNGQILIGSTGLAPVIANITAGTGITVTNGAGSITLSLPNTAVTAGSYTLASITVDAQGRLTAASSGTVSLTTNVSGVLPIANGGTNSSTALNNNRIMVSNAGAIKESASLSNGQILIGSTGLAPVVSTITAGTGINITNGAGSITIAGTSSIIPAGTLTDSVLRWSGTSWVENTLVNISAAGLGSFPNLSVSGNIDNANTTSSTVGNITKGGINFLHNFGTNNLFLGISSGNYTLTGNSCVGLGGSTLLALTSGVQNTAVGYQSQIAVTTGSNNTSLGCFTLNTISTASDCTAIGYNCLTDNTGSNNTGIGSSCLQLNTTGVSNTACGVGALAANLTSNNSTAFGYNALNANTTGENTAFGYIALKANTSGASCTALGSRALAFSTTGSSNNAIGASALGSFTSGNDNIAIGNNAMGISITTSSCLAIGNQALLSVSGSSNTALGYRSSRSMTTGSSNTAVGSTSLFGTTTGIQNVAIGANCFAANIAGNDNTIIGYNGAASTTGNSNIIIGSNAGTAYTSGNNNICFANTGVAGESGTMRFGTSGTHVKTFISGIRGVTTGVADALPVLIDSLGQLGITSSSYTLKENIIPLSDTINVSQIIAELQPVRYNLKTQPGCYTIGLIAEWTASVYPMITSFNEKGNPDAIKWNLIPFLSIAGIQELQKENTSLKNEIDILKNEILQIKQTLGLK